MAIRTLRTGRSRAIAAALAAWLLAMTTGALAIDVPFSAAKAVNGDFGTADRVAAADVDGDGDVDIVGVAFRPNEIAWWENTAGDGNEWVRHLVSSDFHSGPDSLVAADIDGDGDTDIASGAINLAGIRWWENTAGDGSAWTGHVVAQEDKPLLPLVLESVLAEDVDGDGDIDLLGADIGHGKNIWWENTAGDGSDWEEHIIDAAFYGARAIFAADVDGDGDIDVVGASHLLDESEITWWENTAGDGSAWVRHVVDVDFPYTWTVFAADMDGDGDVDILSAAIGADEVAWWENTARDGSAWVKHVVGIDLESARSVFAADIDGDGDIDAAAIGIADITWWENTSRDGTTWVRRALAGDLRAGESVNAADVDGDGDLDLIATSRGTGDVLWWENLFDHPAVTFSTEHSIDHDFAGAWTVHTADVDHDGDIDVVGAGFWGNEVRWWENDAGDGSTWTGHTVNGASEHAISVYPADVDHDGDTDIVGAAEGAGEIAWWENTAGDGSAWTEHSVDAAFHGAWEVFAADVDGDGDTDILGAAWFDGDIAWWENSAGDGSAWADHTIDGEFHGAVAVFAADVDGDGDLDVLGASLHDDEFTWWENTAGDGGTWAEHVVAGDRDGPSSVLAADVDGDGDADIVGSDYGSVTWWENTAGNGSTWIAHAVDVNDGRAHSVHATDVDRDGDVDIVGAMRSGNRVEWWENTAGNGRAWTAHAVRHGYDGASWVAVGDLDRDGDPDLVGAAYFANEVAWWELDHADAVPPGHDSDADGMPDAFESSSGLDPFDPADAALDPDGDGLTNREEYEAGTAIDDPDSDGDGASDGDEVAAGRNPRLHEGAALGPVLDLLLSR